ncbi:MAG: cyclic nucleotide-binding domain-containing protein, partial [Candidatus Thiodiazotropha taylori]
MPNSKSDDVLLKNLVPLNTLSEEQLGHLLSQIVVEKAKKGEYLFREGDTDHQNVYLLSGTVALLSGQKEMDLISSGTPTARFALAHQLPRKHSAQARTVVNYVRIDSRMLSDMLARSHSASYEVKDIEQPSSGDWMSLLLQSPVFQQIPPANLQRVMMRMEEIQVHAGDLIIQQGDEGDYFYLISRGECVVSRQPEKGHAPVELARLKAGKGFGEEALISDKPRGSSVEMATDGVLVRLSKSDFIELVKQPLSRTLSYSEATGYIEKGALWLDVRTPEEYEEGHLPGAINLPFFSLRFQASSLTLDRAYVVYGEEVGQSATAAYLLTERGAEVFVVDVNWAELAVLVGLKSRDGEQPASNVIDFNRDADEGAAETSEEQIAAFNRLKRELDETRNHFNQELEQRQSEIKLLRQALAAAKNKIQSGEQEASAAEGLQQEASELREALQEAQSRLTETEQLESDRQQLQERIEKLEARLETSQQELDIARPHATDVKSHSDDLHRQLDQIHGRHEESEGRLKEQITELQFELETIRESSDEQLQENQRLLTEMESFKGEADDFHQQAEAGLATITQERDELAKQQQETEVRQQQLAEELERLKGEKEQLTVSLNEAEQQNRSLTESVDSLSEEQASLKAALQQA